jgi:hypothetical protein
MNARNLIRATLSVLAALTLVSCQAAYEIDVLSRDGRLTFRFAEDGLSGGTAPRVNYLTVVEVSRPTRYVWKLETIQPNGPMARELRYGEVPDGLKETVHAEKLRRGQLYRVTLFAVDGSGEQHFIISDRHIQKDRVTILH